MYFHNIVEIIYVGTIQEHLGIAESTVYSDQDALWRIPQGCQVDFCGMHIIADNSYFFLSPCFDARCLRRDLSQFGKSVVISRQVLRPCDIGTDNIKLAYHAEQFTLGKNQLRVYKAVVLDVDSADEFGQTGAVVLSLKTL